MLAFATIFLLFLSACGTSAPASNSSNVKATVKAPTDLITPGTLTVGSDTTYTPMEYFDAQTNSNTGFDIQLIQAMGQAMGLKVVIVKANFNTILTDLSNKRYDLVISAITINSDRQKQVDLIPYFNAGESLLVQKGNPLHLTSVADLCGLAVGVQEGTVEQTDLDAASKTCQSQGKPAIKQTVLTSQTDVIQLLANRRVVATYQDSPVTSYYNKINPGQFEVGGSVVNAAPYGIAVRKGDTQMNTAVTAALNAVKSDGVYNNLFQQYGFSADQKG
jgi:polar amino acid transport system substrate-binding protein